MRCTAIGSTLLALGGLSLVATTADAQRTRVNAAASVAIIDTAALTAMRWRYVGPEGNRTISVAGIKGDINTYYAGAASGGIWKTVDGGAHWLPIFDKEPVSSIGAIAVAPSDPNVVWVGTGESFIRSHISLGWGMYRSNDAGKTWARAGLENTGRIARLAVDPSNADRVLVAAEGHAYGPQQERGIYRTLDGGKSWERVLFVNDSTGGVDVLLDPNNPRIVYAAMWQIEIHTWGRESGGAGSSIWKSTDFGTTWKRLVGHGLPEKPYGKVGLGVSAANSNRVYAEIETGDGLPWHGQPTDRGHVWRSDDAGDSWQMVNEDRKPGGRTAYYNRMGVEPDNADEAYFLAADWTKTLDGGKNIIDLPDAQVPRGDHHDVWFDPSNGNRFIVAHDGGISITTTRGREWHRIELPIAQMYHVMVDDKIPYNLYGNRQDGPSVMGPSNSKVPHYYGPKQDIWRGLWRTVGGGEDGWATPDPVDTMLVWSSGAGFGAGGGVMVKWNAATNIAQQVEVWPQQTTGWPADSLKYRFVWQFPLLISPHDHNTVYTGSQHVHVTNDGGQHWRELSPDLTRNDKARQRISGGLTPDNIGVEYAGVVFAIAESKLTKGLIWAGTNDGLVHITRDNGASWINVTANVTGMMEWGTISNIEPSKWDAGTAYLSVDGHQMNNRDPFIYKTTDYGKTWKAIVRGIPKSPLSYVHVVREDPVRKGLLYAGTENGLYVSWDDGENWQPLQNNLPHAPVYWIVVQERFNDLVIATYGRGFWIMDDITPLRQMSADVAATPVVLLRPRDQYRFRPVEGPFTEMDDIVAGENPPDGAIINFWLKAAAKDSATVTITDASGALVRTLKVAQAQGLNRVTWDLNSELTNQAILRASPPSSPWYEVPPSGKPAPGVGRFAILEPPGTYTVTLSAAGETQKQPLVILKDPASGGNLQTIAEQLDLERTIARDLNEIVDQINQFEVVRSQVVAMRLFASTKGVSADLKSAIDLVEAKLMAVEGKLFQMTTTGRGQDFNRRPVRLAEQLTYLASVLTLTDFAPTQPQKDVQGVLHQQWLGIKPQVREFLDKDLAEFNEQVRSSGQRVVVP